MAELRIEVSEAVAQQLARMAGAINSTSEALLTRAAEDMAREGAALAASMARGEADIAAERVVSHEQVMGEMDAWSAAIEARAGA